MYNKYLKYKKKYINLKKQIGGECNPLPNMDDNEYITQEKYRDISTQDRITINNHCYDINALYTWIRTRQNMNQPVTEPATNLPMNQIDIDNVINIFTYLYPNNVIVNNNVQVDENGQIVLNLIRGNGFQLEYFPQYNNDK